MKPKQNISVGKPSRIPGQFFFRVPKKVLVKELEPTQK